MYLIKATINRTEICTDAKCQKNNGLDDHPIIGRKQNQQNSVKMEYFPRNWICLKSNIDCVRKIEGQIFKIFLLWSGSRLPLRDRARVASHPSAAFTVKMILLLSLMIQCTTPITDSSIWEDLEISTRFSMKFLGRF